MSNRTTYWKVLTRRKILHEEGNDSETKLNRVLGLFDLTALGVGSTLGAGVYVLAGQIAKEQAGPSVMLSFAIAALASLLAGICYAEFGARVPKAGSAYIYSYVCIGEFAAFVIGWNLILEYIIGSASVCRGISLYLDTLIDNTFNSTFMAIAPINSSFFGAYFDFFAFGLAVFFGILLAFGVETSTLLNNFCTMINIGVLLFVIVAGSIKADIANWKVDPAKVNIKDSSVLGSGGFFPFGFEGTLKGAATCFFGFVGFDCIATTGEEVRNPRKNIPKSILYSLLIIFLCYFGVSTVLTLMVPYYLQDINAPLPHAFEEVGWIVSKWIVTIGGLIGLFASLFGALFPLPRIIYSMAEDGLMFKFLGKISPRFKTPVIGSVIAAFLTGFIAGIFDLSQLVKMLSIGTLLAYTMVAISITILRYMDNSEVNENGAYPSIQPSENSLLTSGGTKISFKTILLQIVNFKRLIIPTGLSTRIVVFLLMIYCLGCLGCGLLLMYANTAIVNGDIWAAILLGFFIIFLLIVLLSISVQPTEEKNDIFRVPFVPLVPAISIFVNIYLMLQLDVMTWIRFGIWMLIGLPMYIACACFYKNIDARNKKLIKTYPNGITNLGMMASSTNSLENCDLPNKNKLSIQNEIETLSQRNSHDEIILASELGETVKELKNSNGKTIFIENDKIIKENVEEILPPEDDEKSVIALLDDVLQNEENDYRHFEYNRKISVDSQLMPSFVESSTIVIIHNATSSLKEEDTENELENQHENENSYQENDNENFNQNENIEMKIEDECKNEDEDNVTQNDELKVNSCDEQSIIAPVLIDETNLNKIIDKPPDDDDEYNKKYEIAKELVDEILNSNELWSKIEARKLEQIDNKSKNKMNRVFDENSNVIVKNVTPKESRRNSISSIDSATSFNDPIHSDNFKKRLSRLIMKPPPPPPVSILKVKKSEFEEAKTDNSIESPSNTATLKPSKSEADIRKLILKAIEDTSIFDNENNEINCNNNNNNNNNNNMNNNTGIPKAPKFLPALYKTVNSAPYTVKQRPSLEKAMTNNITSDINSKLNDNDNNSVNEPTIPFKVKLEALLKRGPSHRSSKRNIFIPINNNNINSNAKQQNPIGSSYKKIETDDQNLSLNQYSPKMNHNNSVEKQSPSIKRNSSTSASMKSSALDATESTSTNGQSLIIPSSAKPNEIFHDVLKSIRERKSTANKENIKNINFNEQQQ